MNQQQAAPENSDTLTTQFILDNKGEYQTEGIIKYYKIKTEGYSYVSLIPAIEDGTRARCFWATTHGFVESYCGMIHTKQDLLNIL